MEPHRWLAEIAAQIADGQVIDWPEVEARAHDEHDLEVIRRLQSIERLTLAQTALSAAPAEDAAVSSWGPLTIIERVGRGTFGDVYRAWDPRLDRHVALKILRRREVSTPGEESAIIEEARLMARVRHPNIVTVYGAERINGRVGIWMEFVEGRTLEQELRDKGPLGADDVVTVAADLCAALHAVHQAGLLHRDLKAQNVMRSNDGRTLLTDFGTGRERTVGAGGEPVELAGTPLYLAPEVLNGEPASVRSDLYSLGVLLFYLSTGTYPLTGRTLREIRAAHNRRNTADCLDALLRLPDDLAAVIRRASSANASTRYQDTEQLAMALWKINNSRQRRILAFVNSLFVTSQSHQALGRAFSHNHRVLTQRSRASRPFISVIAFFSGLTTFLRCALREVRLIPFGEVTRGLLLFGVLPSLLLAVGETYPALILDRVARVFVVVMPLSMFFTVMTMARTKPVPVAALVIVALAIASLIGPWGFVEWRWERISSVRKGPLLLLASNLAILAAAFVLLGARIRRGRAPHRRTAAVVLSLLYFPLLGIPARRAFIPFLDDNLLALLSKIGYGWWTAISVASVLTLADLLLSPGERSTSVPPLADVHSTRSEQTPAPL